MRFALKQWALPLTALLCTAAVLRSLPAVKQADVAYRAASRPTVLIDAGHGGLTNTID